MPGRRRAINPPIWVVDLHRGRSTQSAGLDVLWALAFRINADKIAEAAISPATSAADTFFWQHYPWPSCPIASLADAP